MPDTDDDRRRCHHCGKAVGRIELVGRRDACLACGADLHCCRNCDFYAPGLHNECRESAAERQVDKHVGNFCDHFRFRTDRQGDARPAAGGHDDSARAKLEALFAKRKA